MQFKVLLASTVITTSLLFASQSTVLAQTTRPKAAANQETRITTIKTRSDTEIDKRLTSLNNALSKISGAKKLSTGDKTKFSAEIQTDIANLTALKTKIDADTDLTTLRADAKTIFTDFRVYAIFLPQIHLLAAADTMGVTADNLTAISTKLASRIQTNQQSTLDDMNAKITDAKTQYAAVEAEIVGLTPANFPATSALTDARNKIKAGAADLKTAVADAKQIRNGLK